ncbi:transferrin receptor protein 1-like isoform 2-T2 [Aulostomus maculatus]
MEGDNSQVEMKLSADMDEEVGVNGVGDHLNHNSTHKPYMAQKFGRSPKNLCFLAATILLIFIIGYLIGYLAYRKRDCDPGCAVPTFAFESSAVHETGAAPLMDWDNVKSLLSQKLSESSLRAVFSDFSSVSHRAGSPGDEDLGNKVIKRFKEYSMKSWSDEHFIKVQDRPASGYNSYVFKNQKKQLLDGFLSYSATGKVTGAVLCVNYGRDEDFMLLQRMNVNLSGKVMLIRTGKISFAEKVANAAKVNASAVLIYPDFSDKAIGDNTHFFGHVHLGSGDPYTPAFPSFNHTQFPPVQSSGLPNILAQTITANMASNIQRELGGLDSPAVWGLYSKLGAESDVISVEVNNVLAEKKINNVFGVIEGFVEPDRFVVIGAQRDAWGPGFAASTVGTSVLVELARSISAMVRNDGFKPRRSIIFASWSAGEYGSVGATEWLEGYLSSLSMKAFSYINLDGIVAGHSSFKVSASPLMYSLIESTLSEVTSPTKPMSLLSQFGMGNWESHMVKPLRMDDAAYPFLAFSGIPSVSFGFTSTYSEYPWFGTLLDTQEKLNSITLDQTPQLAVAAARFAGHMALRLVHDHLLQLDLTKYNKLIRSHVARINTEVNAVRQAWPRLFREALSVKWLMSASGSYSRASRGLAMDIQNSDLEDVGMCRTINDRIMMVERNFLSPFVSPTQSPFRHILLGSGPHTLEGLYLHLKALQREQPKDDCDVFRTQFALATWTIQGCANAVMGHIWAFKYDT